MSDCTKTSTPTIAIFSHTNDKCHNVHEVQYPHAVRGLHCTSTNYQFLANTSLDSAGGQEVAVPSRQCMQLQKLFSSCCPRRCIKRNYGRLCEFQSLAHYTKGVDKNTSGGICQVCPTDGLRTQALKKPFLWMCDLLGSQQKNYTHKIARCMNYGNAGYGVENINCPCVVIWNDQHQQQPPFPRNPTVHQCLSATGQTTIASAASLHCWRS